ncbi:MAG: PhoH family protein [Candidatus Methylomirabilia bacterium]
MKKIYVIDTNVLVHDPEALLRFEDNEVVLPIAVIEELDGLKRGQGEIPASVRQALRLIDSFRELGNLSRSVPLPSGGTLRVETAGGDAARERLSADNSIIMTAVSLGAHSRQPVVLVSKDLAVRIKAEALGVAAQDYRNDKSTIFQRCGRLLETGGSCDVRSVVYRREDDQLVRLRGGREPETVRRRRSLLGISAKNLEQECAIDALVTTDIDVVALTGKAGTGKTLLALAAGIDQTPEFRGQRALNDKSGYEQVMVARPIVPLGQDLGYLPGVVEEKLGPWMQPIHDNLDVIVSTPRDQRKDTRGSAARYKSSDYLIESGIVKIEPLTYIRGRSLPRRFMIIDEAQNLRPLDVKTIITRCGEGTKIVFTGDLEQIDQPYLDATSNGLSYLISRFIDQENFCYVQLAGSARSALAEQAAVLL